MKCSIHRGVLLCMLLFGLYTQSFPVIFDRIKNKNISMLDFESILSSRSNYWLSCMKQDISYEECKLMMNEFTYKHKAIGYDIHRTNRNDFSNDMKNAHRVPDYFDFIVNSSKFLQVVDQISNSIDSSNFHRIVFIHSCSFNVDNRSAILYQILKRIEQSDLHHESKVFVLNYGIKLNSLAMERYNWVQFYEVSTIVEAYELPTLFMLQTVLKRLKNVDRDNDSISSANDKLLTKSSFQRQRIRDSTSESFEKESKWNRIEQIVASNCCFAANFSSESSYPIKKRESMQILYLHTKGASYNQMSENVHTWTDLMLHYLVDRHRSCDHLFRSGLFNLIGVEVRWFNNVFSGNFWWASYDVLMHSLWPESRYLDKYFAEMWILFSQYPDKRMFVPWNSEKDLYFDSLDVFRLARAHHDRFQNNIGKNNVDIIHCQGYQ